MIAGARRHVLPLGLALVGSGMLTLMVRARRTLSPPSDSLRLDQVAGVFSRLPPEPRLRLLPRASVLVVFDSEAEVAALRAFSAAVAGALGWGTQVPYKFGGNVQWIVAAPTSVPLGSGPGPQWIADPGLAAALGEAGWKSVSGGTVALLAPGLRPLHVFELGQYSTYRSALSQFLFESRLHVFLQNHSFFGTPRAPS